LDLERGNDNGRLHNVRVLPENAIKPWKGKGLAGSRLSRVMALHGRGYMKTGELNKALPWHARPFPVFILPVPD